MKSVHFFFAAAILVGACNKNGTVDLNFEAKDNDRLIDVDFGGVAATFDNGDIRLAIGKISLEGDQTVELIADPTGVAIIADGGKGNSINDQLKGLEVPPGSYNNLKIELIQADGAVADESGEPALETRSYHGAGLLTVDGVADLDTKTYVVFAVTVDLPIDLTIDEKGSGTVTVDFDLNALYAGVDFSDSTIEGTTRFIREEEVANQAVMLDNVENGDVLTATAQ